MPCQQLASETKISILQGVGRDDHVRRI
jgi:hypothetical protein